MVGAGILITPKDDSPVVYQFALSIRKSGSIFAEARSGGFEFDGIQSIKMMREYLAFIDRQTLAAAVAEIVVGKLIDKLQTQRIFAAVQGSQPT